MSSFCICQSNIYFLWSHYFRPIITKMLWLVSRVVLSLFMRQSLASSHPISHECVFCINAVVLIIQYSLCTFQNILYQQYYNYNNHNIITTWRKFPEIVCSLHILRCTWNALFSTLFVNSWINHLNTSFIIYFDSNPGLIQSWQSRFDSFEATPTRNALLQT